MLQRMTNLIQRKVGAVPRDKEDRRVGAIASEPARGPPVRSTPDAIPGLIRHAVDTSDLVV